MPSFPPEVESLARFLAGQYAQGLTVEDARLHLEEAGVSPQIIRFIPGMVYDATAAAVDILNGDKTRDEAVRHLQQTGAPREDIEYMIDLALDGIQEAMDTAGGEEEDGEGDDGDPDSAAASTSAEPTLAFVGEGDDGDPDESDDAYEDEDDQEDDDDDYLDEGDADDDDSGMDDVIFAPDFSSPVTALASIEEAYRRQNLQDLLLCKSFELEVGFVLNEYQDVDLGEHPVEEIAELCREHFISMLETEGWPDWNGVTAIVTGIEELPDNMVVCTEEITLPNGDFFEQQMFVGLTPGGEWKVVLPYTPELAQLWREAMS